jgi:hypothetical protein
MKKKTLNVTIAALTVALLVMLAFSRQAMAQRYYANRHKGHRVFAWAGGGYSRLDLHLDNVSTLGFVGGILGVGYGYSFNARWAANAGVEYALLGSSIRPFGFTTELQMLDTEGTPFIMHYSFNRYQERQYARYLNVPLSVEYASGKLYYVAGVKAGLHVGATSITTVNQVETKGEYERYIGAFEEMPDHFFTKTDVRTANSIRFGTNIIASAEVGMNIARNEQKTNPLRIGVFCDYGLSNIQQSAGKEPVRYEENPIFINSNNMAGNVPQRITSFMVGLKLTVFFKSPNTKRVYPCFCYPMKS